jgi:glycopeptide antibiotics resistance protein
MSRRCAEDGPRLFFRLAAASAIPAAPGQANSGTSENGGNMRKRGIETFVLYGVFVCYIILLIKVLLLSRVSLPELFSGQNIATRSVNVIPFRSIMEVFIASSEAKTFSFGNVIGNILIFIPLGLYLPLIKKDKRMAANLLLVLIVSFSVEVVQGLLGIGTADIDDVILNSLGGWIGILGYRLFMFLFRDAKKVRTATTILAAVVGLPIVFYLLFMIKMRF